MSTPALFALIVCVGLFTALCTFWDVRWMKMPNKITVPAFVAGLVFHFARGWYEKDFLHGLHELFFWSICGFAVGFGVLFISFATGRGGGGDVKFMGALGAWLGPWWTVVVLIVTAVFVVITGTISLFVLAFRKGGNQSVASKFASPFRTRKKINQGPKRQRLVAYAIPVTCAVWTLFGLILVNEFTSVKFSFLSPHHSHSAPPASADSAVQTPRALPS